MHAFINWIKQPAQLLSAKQKFWIYLLLGLYCYIFFLFFQPFGVNNYDPRESITLEFAMIMLTFCSFISLVLLINEWLLFRPLADYLLLRWQLIGWLIWTLGFSASLIFLFYNWLGGWHDFSVSSWLEFIANFAMLGIIPGVIIYMYARMQQLKDLTHTAQDYKKDALQLVTFPSDNQKDLLSLPLEDILYLESEDNYVAVHCLQLGQKQKILVRLTLKRVQDSNLHPALLRCHRSYMVNLIHLQQYSGNQQQGSLWLRGVDQPFPVSKTYASGIVNVLKE